MLHERGRDADAEELDPMRRHARLARYSGSVDNPLGGYSGAPIVGFDLEAQYLLGIAHEGQTFGDEAKLIGTAWDDIAARLPSG